MKPVRIAGGGLAGLTLGIALRQRGVTVEILEAGRYPRHRVCGEFISGNGQAVLDQLALMPVVERAGARVASDALFCFGSRSSAVQPLPLPALSISRHNLDAALAEHFRDLGGQLHEDTRWRGAETEEGVVVATGRRPQPVDHGWRWFGLKAHVTGVDLAADLEMHFRKSGYVGLNRLENGRVNVCGLFRRAARDSTPPTVTIQGLASAEPNSVLAQRLAGASIVPGSNCAVAGLSLQPTGATRLDGCRIGDAVAMIPPLTGNGMSMAFEAAALAAGPLGAYAEGELSWTAARNLVAQQWDERFSRRLAWASWLQQLAFSERWANTLGPLLASWGLAWRWMFAHTR